MAKEHADNKMIQRALIGQLKPEADRALQKICRKKQPKSNQLLIEILDLNTGLVEDDKDLDHVTRCRVVTRVRGEGRDHGGLGLRSRGEGIGLRMEA